MVNPSNSRPRRDSVAWSTGCAAGEHLGFRYTRLGRPGEHDGSPPSRNAVTGRVAPAGRRSQLLSVGQPNVWIGRGRLGEHNVGMVRVAVDGRRRYLPAAEPRGLRHDRRPTLKRPRAYRGRRTRYRGDLAQRGHAEAIDGHPPLTVTQHEDIGANTRPASAFRPPGREHAPAKLLVTADDGGRRRRHPSRASRACLTNASGRTSLAEHASYTARRWQPSKFTEHTAPPSGSQTTSTDRP